MTTAAAPEHHGSELMMCRLPVLSQGRYCKRTLSPAERPLGSPLRLEGRPFWAWERFRAAFNSPTSRARAFPSLTASRSRASSCAHDTPLMSRRHHNADVTHMQRPWTRTLSKYNIPNHNSIGRLTLCRYLKVMPVPETCFGGLAARNCFSGDFGIVVVDHKQCMHAHEKEKG